MNEKNFLLRRIVHNLNERETGHFRIWECSVFALGNNMKFVGKVMTDIRFCDKIFTTNSEINRDLWR